MTAKILWKTALFGFSLFMLLLTMGYGKGDYSVEKNWGTFSGQAKVARPGARIKGFQSVSPPPEPEKTVWDTIRDTSDEWLGGGSMMNKGTADASKTELQKLQSRAKPLPVFSTMSLN